MSIKLGRTKIGFRQVLAKVLGSLIKEIRANMILIENVSKMQIDFLGG